MRIGATTLKNYTEWCRRDLRIESDAAQSRAWERIRRVVDDDPAEALRALTVVAQTLHGDEWGLGCLGADALEDLFREHADVLLARLEQQLAEDEPLRVAAATIWLHRHESYGRLRRAIGLPEDARGAPAMQGSRVPATSTGYSQHMSNPDLPPIVPDPDLPERPVPDDPPEPVVPDEPSPLPPDPPDTPVNPQA
jgi:hypothetical protein